MAEYLLRLSWPNKPLWQNRRVHWRKRSDAAANYRREAWAIAKQHKVARSPDAELHFFFHQPDNRKRDLQNMPATQKAAIDGIADAMGCDDSGFKCHWPVEWSDNVKGGCVLIHIKPKTVILPLIGAIS